MDTKYILIAIFLLVIFLQMRNKESFSTGLLNKETREQYCTNATNLLNEVNKFQKQSCKDDDTKPNNQVVNDRLTCRNFEEKKIFLAEDRKSHCKGLKNKPQLLKFNKVGNFNGINKLEHTEGLPTPVEDLHMDESEFPFEMNMIDTEYLNLDNKSA
jgi:hypothetical protein